MISFSSLALNNIYKLIGPKFISPGQTLPWNSTCFPRIVMGMSHGISKWEFCMLSDAQSRLRQVFTAPCMAPLLFITQAENLQVILDSFLSCSHLQHPNHLRGLFFSNIYPRSSTSFEASSSLTWVAATAANQSPIRPCNVPLLNHLTASHCP